MRKTILTAALALAALLSPQAEAQTVLQNVYAHKHTSLNGSWQTIIDPFDAGFYDYRLKESRTGFFQNRTPQSKQDLVEYDFVPADQLYVPGDWNTQRPELFLYEGSIWYKKDFTYQRKPGTRLYLYFGAANYLTYVYLNGEKLGTHEGGFTPFHFDITDRVKDGANFVVVRVNDDRKPENVPTVNSDWWNYGGITRDVLLVETPDVYVDDYRLDLAPGKYNELCGYVQLNRPAEGQQVTLNIPELKLKQTLTTDARGRAAFTLKAKPRLWSPEDPKLYDVSLSCGEETLSDHIGFRRIETQGKSVLLNGQKTFLRGIAIHEEAPFRAGRVASEAECRTLLQWAKELGCNFVRLAHYPHSEAMVRLAEEMGLMVWSEIPVYWTIHWDNPDTYRNAERQLTDMIARDKNRCAVVIWSIANETPHSPERDQFLGNLATRAREMDGTRLLSMAMEVTGTKANTNRVEDNMSRYVDIVSFNCYLGWYNGTLDDLNTRQWDIPYDKPFFVSEFGAGALAGRHGAPNELWTEEYQAELYRRTLQMYDRVEGFAGTSPWILMDFRSARRQVHGVQDFYNRKGIVSNRGEKKQAFYVLQDFYRKKAGE